MPEQLHSLKCGPNRLDSLQQFLSGFQGHVLRCTLSWNLPASVVQLVDESFCPIFVFFRHELVSVKLGGFLD